LGVLGVYLGELGVYLGELGVYLGELGVYLGELGVYLGLFLGQISLEVYIRVTSPESPHMGPAYAPKKPIRGGGSPYM